MHSHCGLAAARHALDDQIGKGGLADDGILFLLDGGNDLSQHGILVFGQILHQQFVAGGHITVIVAQESAVFHAVGSL